MGNNVVDVCTCKAIFCAKGTLNCDATRREWIRNIESGAEAMRKAVNPGGDGEVYMQSHNKQGEGVSKGRLLLVAVPVMAVIVVAGLFAGLFETERKYLSQAVETIKDGESNIERNYDYYTTGVSLEWKDGSLYFVSVEGEIEKRSSGNLAVEAPRISRQQWKIF